MHWQVGRQGFLQKYLHVHVWGEDTRWTNPFPWGYVFTLSDWHTSPLFSIIEAIISEMFNCKSITQLRKFKLHRTMGAFKDVMDRENHTPCFPSLNSKTQATYCCQGLYIVPPNDKRTTHWFQWETLVHCGGKKNIQRGVYGLGLL